MNSCRSWMVWVAAVSVVGAQGLKAEETPVPIPAKRDAADPAKMEVQKKHEADEQQKRMEQVKKQITERQATIEKISQMLTINKDEDMKPLLDKQLEFNKKLLGLLQDMQMALEGQNKERMESLYAQIRELNSAWNGMGEAAARMDVERAKMKKLMGPNPTPEMTAAMDEYNAACDGVLKVWEKKQALEKEFRDMTAKQHEAAEKIHKASRSAVKPGNAPPVTR